MKFMESVSGGEMAALRSRRRWKVEHRVSRGRVDARRCGIHSLRGFIGVFYGC